MKTGANRKTIGTSAFFLTEQRPEPLGKIARTDFNLLPGAERDILDAFVMHRSMLSALQNAPDLKALQGRLESLTRTVQICRDQMAAFLEFGKSHGERLEFRATISELIMDQGLERQDLDFLIDDAVENLARICIFLAAAKLALDERVSSGEIVFVSSRQLRHEFFRKLMSVLRRHGLDEKVGENSLIVHLVIRLEGQWKLTAKSGPESSKEAEVDRRIRKDLAAEIKTAVKAQ